MLKSKASQVAFAAMALKQASPVRPVARRLPPAMLFPGYACQPDGSTTKGNLSQNQNLEFLGGNPSDFEVHDRIILKSVKLSLIPTGWTCEIDDGESC